MSWQRSQRSSAFDHVTFKTKQISVCHKLEDISVHLSFNNDWPPSTEGFIDGSFNEWFRFNESLLCYKQLPHTSIQLLLHLCKSILNVDLSRCEVGQITRHRKPVTTKPTSWCLYLVNVLSVTKERSRHSYKPDDVDAFLWYLLLLTLYPHLSHDVCLRLSFPRCDLQLFVSWACTAAPTAAATTARAVTHPRDSCVWAGVPEVSLWLILHTWVCKPELLGSERWNLRALPCSPCCLWVVVA